MICNMPLAGCQFHVSDHAWSQEAELSTNPPITSSYAHYGCVFVDGRQGREGKWGRREEEDGRTRLLSQVALE